MSADRYVCCDERRRALLLADAGAVSGIDYIDVVNTSSTTDPVFIDIVLVKPLPLPLAKLTVANITLTGGIRYPAPRIDPLIAATPGGATVARYRLTIPPVQPTDFSTYRLTLVSGPGSADPPNFIDPRLAAVDFSFKIDCPSDFDCAPDCDDRPDMPPPEPMFDYRVRDYQGFRRQMLDRIAALVPGFREDDPVDFTTTLVEAMAYRADQQSYRLDWVGTEAFLDTARSRASVTRHARLVDYPVSEGASARLFARLNFVPGGGFADGAVTLAKSTPLLVRHEQLPSVLAASDYARLLTRTPLVFETVAALRLWQWRNHIDIYSWSDDECRLPSGSTAATLVDKSGGAGELKVGELLLFIETKSPATGDPDDARRDHRHVVRITRVASVTDVLAPAGTKLLTVEWHPEDALPFDLIVQARVAGTLGSAATAVCAEAGANLMLANHGASYPPPTSLLLTPAEKEALRPRLEPAAPIDGAPWRPVLDRGGVARTARIDLEAAPLASATTLARVDASACLPDLALDDEFAVWEAQHDLLQSGRFSRDFVIETAIDGRATFRFGDAVNGLPPSPGTAFAAHGRFGFGTSGNLGGDALAHVVVPAAQVGARITVSNPLPGRGGAAPESVAQIRIDAPQAFRVQQRAVTAADYAVAAMRHPAVANALAIPRWTGAWQTMLIYIDRKDGLPVDRPFRAALLAHLEYYRLMGFDVALHGAQPSPLDLELMVCACAGELRSSVAARVRAALDPFGPAGAHGFFHPDNFSFGAPLYLSRLIAAVMAVDGVQNVTPHKFQRLGRLPAGELAAGVIYPGQVEVLQLDNDPSFPERGRLALTMGGGR